MNARRRCGLALAVLGLIACGGTTASNGPSDASAGNPQICGLLADSGVDFQRCLATKCCGELTTCSESSDGTAYDNCIVNCLFDGGAFSPDGGNACNDSCAAAHPAGAAACKPYFDCSTMNCAPAHH